MPRTRKCLRLEEWPEIDRVLWAAGTRAVNLFEVSSVAATWRPRTVSHVEEGYGYALAWLRNQDALDPLMQPEGRWGQDQLRRYLSNMQETLSPCTVANRLIALERALAVLSPSSDRRDLKRIIKHSSALPAKDSKRVRLRSPAQLVDFGLELMRIADSRHAWKPKDRKNASTFRDGLQIALLAHRALRRRNFSNLRWGSELVRTQDGFQLAIPASDTKTRVVIDLPVPTGLTASLDRYLDVYRPLLAGNRYRGDRLWVTYLYTPQAPHSFQVRIAALTAAKFGQPVNPHLFRDCAATHVAIHDPQNVRMAATILGHRSFATTEKHYNLANSLEAGRLYLDELAILKKSARRSLARGHRRLKRAD